MAIAFDPSLLGGNPHPDRAKSLMEKIKQRATKVKETPLESLDPLLSPSQRARVHMNQERLLPETDLLMILCGEDAELERAFQRRFLQVYFKQCPAEGPDEGLSYGQFLTLVDEILSGEVMAAKESVRLWKLSMPRSQERDGLWEQAKLHLDQIMVGVMHDSSQLRAIFRKNCPLTEMHPAKVVCSLTRDQLQLADGLQDQWNLFQPVIYHHMATLRRAKREGDAVKVGALHRAVGDVMAKKFDDVQTVQIAFRLYQSLLETTYEQVVGLAREVEVITAGKDRDKAGLKQWENSQKVLSALESTIKECHIICHGSRSGSLPACLLRNEDDASVGKADTIKYIRLMGTALARQAAVVSAPQQVPR